MLPNKYYYAHTGDDFENLKVLGLCCVLKPGQKWPPQLLRQHLHLHGTKDQNLLERRYDHAESTTRWTLAYRLDLTAIDTVFVEVETIDAKPHKFAELSDTVVNFLSSRLPQNWSVMDSVSRPAWQGVPALPIPWPPGFDTLKPVPVPPPSPPPTPTPSRTSSTTDGCTSVVMWLIGIVVILGLFTSATRPRPADVAGSQTNYSQPQPPAVPIPPATPYPTSAPCPLGCNPDPKEVCPLTLIKGIVTPSNQRLYYEPGHREYNQQSVNPYAGGMWFCTVQEAQKMGFAPAP